MTAVSFLKAGWSTCVEVGGGGVEPDRGKKLKIFKNEGLKKIGGQAPFSFFFFFFFFLLKGMFQISIPGSPPPPPLTPSGNVNAI